MAERKRLKRSLTDVLLFTELYPPDVGGSAVLFHEIYSRLPQRKVAVLTEPRHRPGGSASYQILEQPVSRNDWGLIRPSSVRHRWKVAQTLKQLSRSAVVHCGRALPEGTSAWMSLWSGGSPYVCWAHGEDLVAAATSRELAFLARRVLGKAAFVIANSNSTARIVRDCGGTRDRTIVVYPGVDIRRFKPEPGSSSRRWTDNDGVFLLLSVGRLQRRKGHDLAIRAVASLRSLLPNLRYIIAGDGDERDRLQNLVGELRVADLVSFTGQVSDADLPSLYSACDVFLLPNRIESADIEGFGIVFLEAAAAGKPVVGGNSGGVPEAVDDGATGLLVSGTSEDELSSVIMRLATDKDLRVRMGAAGRRRVVDHFSWDAAAAKIECVQALVEGGS